jgi:hypothetical protein
MPGVSVSIKWNLGQGFFRRLLAGHFTYDKQYLLFYIWVPLICFQEFLNFLLPVSLRFYETFLCFGFFGLSLIQFGRWRKSDYSFIAVLSIVVFLFSCAMLVQDINALNMRWFMYATMPLVGYTCVRGLEIRFNERFAMFTMFLFLVVTAYGIYEYFFAQYQLADIVAARGKVTTEYMYMGMYLQKINTANRFYRSMSFILEFVYFGYFGLASVFLCVAWYMRSHTKTALVSILIAVFGTLTSLSMSTVAAGFVSLVAYGLLKARPRKKFILLIVLAIGIGVYYSLIVMVNNKIDVGFVKRLVMVAEGTDYSTQQHMQLSWEELSKVSFLGKSWETTYEHEYIDAYMRMGILGATTYFLVYLLIYLRIAKVMLTRSPLAVWAAPAFLLMTSFIFIGFVHHSFCATNLTAFFLILFATVENSIRWEKSRRFLAS